MACWIALSDTDPKNGGLCVVPGSHKRHLYKTEPPSDEKEHNRWVQNYKMRDEQGKEREYLRQYDLKLVVLFLSCSHHIVL